MTAALVNQVNDILRYQDFDDAPPNLASAKGLRWLPVIDTLPTPGAGERLTGPVVTVGADDVTRVWALELIPLEEIKAARKSAATDRRKTERDKGVLVSGIRWQSDKESFDNVASHLATGKLYEAGHGVDTFKIPWKTTDGFITASLLNLNMAHLAIGLFIQACFAREAELAQEIDAAETAEDVLLISLDTDWPGDETVIDTSFIQAILQSNARLERQAKELEQQGDFTGAQLLRLQIKEI